MTKKRLILKGYALWLIPVFLLAVSCTSRETTIEFRTENLNSGWKMISSDDLAGTDGASVSSLNHIAETWLDAVVPGTVLGSMTLNGVIEDPYFGINMQDIDPGQFKNPWWYRTTFMLSAGDLEKVVNLRFQGVSYAAELWVNGKIVAGMEEFAGTYRMFTFNINNVAREGKNVVALKVRQHADGEYSIGFVDWNPHAPDRNMGIFREVFLEVSAGLKIRSPFVWSKVNRETLKDADLFIQAELENSAAAPVEGILRVDYGLGVVEKAVTVPAGETVSCRFEPTEFPQLSVTDVKLWWPNGIGEPHLYPVKATFVSGRKMLDKVEKRYGIREITSALNEDGHRAFEVNGRFVLLKGGGWVDDLFLMDTRESIEAQMKYVRHMNLNSIRAEGFWGKTEDLYDLCDEYGVLVMIGWSCHWEWDEYLLKPTHEKYGGAVTPEDIELMAAYQKDQMLWLRNHPSIYVWMLGSDKLPAPELEYKYIELFKKYDPSRSYITSAGGAGTEDNNIVAEVPLVSDISGPTGMKMLGPYAFTPPVYWFTDTQLGGAYGFNTETCPGPNVPPLASLKKMLPEESLWPIDKDYWEFHTGRNNFKTLDRFRRALDSRYGPSESVEEFAYKSQISNYEVMRPMFEAFVAHKPKSTGLVQWMLNSAWPEMYWQLYDTYLQPNGSFYAVRKACNPLHAIYRYGFNDIYVANENLQDAEDITVSFRIFDIHSKEIFADQWKGTVKNNISQFIYKIPEIKNLTDVWFLDLRITDREGREVDNSIYWLSLKEDVLDYEAAKALEWPFYTPTKAFADFTALDRLPKIQPEFSWQTETGGEYGVVTLTVKNVPGTIAFFLFFDLVDTATGQPVLPVYWDDNYVTLLPGEERTYSARYNLSDMKGGKPQLRINGWNVETVVLE